VGPVAPIFLGGGSGAASLNQSQATLYMPAGSLSTSATQANVAVPLPVGGTITNLQVRLSGVAGAGNSYTFTAYRNGAAVATLTCSVSGDTATSCSDTDDTVWNAGDTISLQAIPFSNPSGRTGTWSITLG
jgi:hypothetical protein